MQQRNFSGAPQQQQRNFAITQSVRTEPPELRRCAPISAQGPARYLATVHPLLRARDAASWRRPGAAHSRRPSAWGGQAERQQAPRKTQRLGLAAGGSSGERAMLHLGVTCVLGQGLFSHHEHRGVGLRSSSPLCCPKSCFPLAHTMALRWGLGNGSNRRGPPQRAGAFGGAWSKGGECVLCSLCGRRRAGMAFARLLLRHASQGECGEFTPAKEARSTR